MSEDWREEDGALVRDWTFDDFTEAIAFVNKVAEAAEDQGHHPDILVHDFKEVRLTLQTHSTRELTDADRELASAIDGL